MIRRILSRFSLSVFFLIVLVVSIVMLNVISNTLRYFKIAIPVSAVLMVLTAIWSVLKGR